jgi:hypothetical protein
MTELTHTAPQARDFSAATRRALLARGIRIVGVQAVPADDSDRYFSATAYCLDDNGTHRLRRHAEVFALVAHAPSPFVVRKTALGYTVVHQPSGLMAGSFSRQRFARGAAAAMNAVAQQHPELLELAEGRLLTRELSAALFAARRPFDEDDAKAARSTGGPPPASRRQR